LSIASSKTLPKLPILAIGRRFPLPIIKNRQHSLISSLSSLRLPCFSKQSGSAYPSEDGREQLLRHRYLRHLKDYVSCMANYLRTNLDHLLPEGRHRPVADSLRQHCLAEEVPEVVRKDEELQPNLIVDEVMARQPRPLYRILALFDPLLGRSSVVVETNDALLRPAEIGHDEPDPREELSSMPFHFRDHQTLTTPRRGLVLKIVVSDDWCM
jgi:hypothetical protein